METHEDDTLLHTGAATSAAAAQAMEEPARGMRLQILQHIVKGEPDGSTADESQHRLHLKHQTNSPRFVELAEDELIYDSRVQRVTRSGHQAIVWRPTEKGLEAIRLGWYHGERIVRGKRESRIGMMRAALTEALKGWEANMKDPDQIERIRVLEKLVQPRLKK